MSMRSGPSGVTTFKPEGLSARTWVVALLTANPILARLPAAIRSLGVLLDLGEAEDQEAQRPTCFTRIGRCDIR